jgi:hypothetical protein
METSVLMYPSLPPLEISIRIYGFEEENWISQPINHSESCMVLSGYTRILFFFVTIVRIFWVKILMYDTYFIIIIIIIIYLNCKWGFARWQCTAIRHNTQIAHITQNNTPHSNKHSTQTPQNNNGQTTHNECNANTITTTCLVSFRFLFFITDFSTGLNFFIRFFWQVLG